MTQEDINETVRKVAQETQSVKDVSEHLARLWQRKQISMFQAVAAAREAAKWLPS